MESNSRPESPEAPPQDLWSSILDSVSSSRSIPSKQVLILGQPSTGKSTLSSALLQKPPSDGGKDEPATDFALGYDWADVRDEGEEDILARLSVYTVPSSAQAYTSLVPHFLPPRASLPHTAVVIVLDWTKPWTFVEELLTWLIWIEAWVKGDASRETVIAREENRERLQHYFQHYTEPSTEPIPATTSTLQDTVLEITPGALTNNTAGVPIIVACTKADLIDDNNDIAGAGATGGMGGMVKGKGGEWEERTDGIMQVLRTICLRYGASLFYTTPQPVTLQALRQYALHMLFIPPAPSPGSESVTPPRNPFPFTQKPNTLDRDRIVVPTGWDSWGKITLLREGFDAKAWGEAWERALEVAAGEPVTESTATKMYAQLVQDQGAKPHPLPPLNEPVPEQTFLAKNYDEIAKRGDKDPRGIFRNPTETPAAGVVGPLGSTSLGLPMVERALEDMESSMNLGASTLGASTTRRPGAPAAPVPRSALAASQGPRSPSTPTIPGAPGGQSNHEVLHNFFQSLLSSKDRAGASAAAAQAGGPPTRTNGGTGGEGGSGTEDGGG